MRQRWSVRNDRNRYEHRLCPARRVGHLHPVSRLDGEKGYEMNDWIVFLIGFAILLFAVWASTRGTSGSRRRVQRDSRETAITRQPKHETYTNDEILGWNVDVRRKDPRKQIELAKWAVEHKATPAWYEYRINQQIADNRRNRALGTEADAIDGEVSEVKQLPAGRGGAAAKREE
jgi:FtsZ-interacting cell division protein ZipA